MHNTKTITRLISKLTIGILIFTMTGCGKKQTNQTTTEVSETEQTTTETVTEDSEADRSEDNTQEPVTDADLSYQLTETMDVTEESDGKIIIQTDVVNGRTYSLTLNLENANGYTTREQLVMCTKVFWYCYPQMYEKMAVADTPVDVNLLVEDMGYEIAEQWGNNVHLHDRWLCDNPDDYDCLTHEFAHVIQTNWEADYSPQYEGEAYLIERFADACRYMYAYEGGIYNDQVWTLQTPDVENHYSISNRFFVWLEQTYSTDEIDIFKRLVEQTQIKDEAHSWENWESGGPMWDVIFEGTEAEGKTLEQLWDIFVATR